MACERFINNAGDQVAIELTRAQYQALQRGEVVVHPTEGALQMIHTKRGAETGLPRSVLVHPQFGHMRFDIEADAEVRVAPPGNWPMASDAMGCHPDQIGDYRRELERHGVSADFTRDGRVVLESAGHRRRVAEAMGYYDRNSYGGRDPQRLSDKRQYGA